MGKNNQETSKTPTGSEPVVKRLVMFLDTIPDIDDYRFIEGGKHFVTQEWLCGTFAGRSFCDETYTGAVKQMSEYLDRHVGHNSMVGDAVTKSGWPDLEKVWRYIEPKYRIDLEA